MTTNSERPDQTTQSVKLSVRELVEFSARKGDLGFDDANGPTNIEGIQGHKKIQQSRSAQWLVEHKLTQRILINHIDDSQEDPKTGLQTAPHTDPQTDPHKDLKTTPNTFSYTVTLQGRADLIDPSTTPAIVEEIKTTYLPPSQIDENKKFLHQAQARVYAYLYAQETQADAICARISYYNLLDKSLHQQDNDECVSDLKNFTLDLLQTYIAWHHLHQQQLQATRLSAQQISFPFPEFRDGQQQFARANYRALRDRHPTLIEAPTGTGKTVSALFSSIKAHGESLIEQTVYLTAKVSGQRAAIDTLDLFCRAGIESSAKETSTLNPPAPNAPLNTTYLIIQAKDKTCPCRSSDPLLSQGCAGENGQCNRTLGFYDRLPEARVACMQAQHLTPDTLQRISDTHHLCPFALSMHLIRWINIIVCDYNYVFDPLVQLAVFNEHTTKRSLLGDEVHNLPERARSMYSARLSALDTHQIGKQIDKQHKRIKRLINKLAKQLSTIEGQDKLLDQPPVAIDTITDRLLAALKETDPYSMSLVSQGDILNAYPTAFPQWLKQLYRYKVIRELYGDNHTTRINQETLHGKSHTVLELICLDASEHLKQSYRSARHFTGFSATLTPANFYLDLLGLAAPKQQQTADVAAQHITHSLQLPAVFPTENQCTIRCDYIDTRWQQRNASVAPIAALIKATFNAKPGKYLVFFPSYAYMETVYQYTCEHYTALPTQIQRNASSEKDKQNYLNEFFTHNKPMIGFAITGGIYGEGVDFAGDALDGVIVVGTGMPPPGVIQKRIENRYQQQGYNGFKYAYQFPGFTRVQQAAGRVIRSNTDRGVVILVDQRFSRHDYQVIMPRHWLQQGCGTLESVSGVLEQFWPA